MFLKEKIQKKLNLFPLPKSTKNMFFLYAYAYFLKRDKIIFIIILKKYKMNIVTGLWLFIRIWTKYKQSHYN